MRKTGLMATLIIMLLTGCGGPNATEIVAAKYRTAVNTGDWEQACNLMHPDLKVITGGFHTMYRLQRGDTTGAQVVQLRNERNPGSECSVGMLAMANQIDFTMPDSFDRTEQRDDGLFAYTPDGTWTWDRHGQLIDAPWLKYVFSGPDGL